MDNQVVAEALTLTLIGVGCINVINKNNVLFISEIFKETDV